MIGAPGRELRRFVHSDGFLGTGQLQWTSRDWLTYWLEEDDQVDHHLHLWGVVEPVERSFIRLYPLESSGCVSGLLRFWNARGEIVNECTLASRAGQSVHLPISAFLDECELDGGLRHAHLELITRDHCSGEVEISSSTRSTCMAPLHRLDQKEPRALPLTISSQHHHVLALINPNDVQCGVKCRLFLDSRTPEELCLVPPRGTLLIAPEVLFSPVIAELSDGAGAATERQAYLRLTTRSPKCLGFQLLEERVFSGGERVYGVVV